MRGSRTSRSHLPLAIAALSAAAIIASCDPGPTKTELVYFTDLEGILFPKVAKEVRLGGTGLLSASIRSFGEEGDGPLLVAGGNSLFGTPEAFFTKGKAVMDAFKALGVDAYLLGHREFYFGQEQLASLAGNAGFPFVCANVVDANGAVPPYLKAFVYFPERRLGLIGLVSHKFEQTNVPQDIAGLSRLDPAACVPQAVAELKRLGARTIAVGGDLLFDPEADAGDQDAQFLEAVRSIEGIDVILARSLAATEGFEREANGPSPLVVAAKTRGEEAVLLSIEGGKARVGVARADSATREPDPAMATLLADLDRAFAELSSDVVGMAAADIPHSFREESPLGNLICDILRAYAGTDVFVRNSGSIREGFKAGPITRMDLYKVQPWEGIIAVTSLTGAQLLRVLESSVAYKLDKSFLQVSGLSFEYDPDAPAFARIIPGSVKVGLEPLDPERRYTLASTDYVILGGDQYVEFPEMGIGIERKLPKPLRSIVEAYIRANSPISAAIEGRARKAKR
jgi:2',3'-cyclic-nucleotide 2'-phosphodiesterase (5'-nucleotidase family)